MAGRSGDVGAACGVGRIVGHVPPRRPGRPYRRLASGTACSVRLPPPRNAITRTAYSRRLSAPLISLIGSPNSLFRSFCVSPCHGSVGPAPYSRVPARTANTAAALRAPPWLCSATRTTACCTSTSRVRRARSAGGSRPFGPARPSHCRAARTPTARGAVRAVPGVLWPARSNRTHACVRACVRAHALFRPARSKHCRSCNRCAQRSTHT